MRRILFALALVTCSSLAAAAPEKDLTLFGSVVYGPRDISGTIFVNRDGPVSSLATADTLGLGTARAFQLRLGAQYKRWRFNVDYLPTNYDGVGFADVRIEIGDLPPIPAQTEVVSDIDVNLLLANVSYDVFRSDRWTAALGVGFGRTDIDVALVPKVGEPLAFDGKTPFGYIGGDAQWRFAERFNARFALQWISGEFDGARIDYGNYNAALGYVLSQSRLRTELVGGYRRVDFKFDYSVPGERVETDLTLEGPYLGVVLAW